MNRRRLCVLLPAYNEAPRIDPVVTEAVGVRIDGIDITVLVVNDGSKDETAAVAERAGATVLSHPKNRGVGAAFRTGRDWAVEQGFDFLVHMDSDGQVLPREIPLLFAPVGAGEADVALGSRFVAGAPPHLAPWKALALKSMARTVGLLTGYPRLSDLSCGFRCMNAKILESMRPSFDYDYIQETMIQALAAGARIVEVPVTVLYEDAPKGMSQHTLRYIRRSLGLTAYGLGNFYQVRIGRLLAR